MITSAQNYSAFNITTASSGRLKSRNPLMVVKGDSKFGNIAAASILAKTYRDEFMVKASKEYPGYNWEVNKGYPTRDHRAAIAAIGPSPIHRMTFRLLPDGGKKEEDK